MITDSDFEKLKDYINDWFSETAKRKVGENVGMQVFNVFETLFETYEHVVLHGLEGIEKVTPGQDLPVVSGEQGDSIIWTQEYYGARPAVTKHLRKFDRYDQIEKIVRSVSQDAFDKIDKSMSDVLVNGWDCSTSGYTDVYGESVTVSTPGSKDLFASNHTTPLSSDTFSNIITDGTNTNPDLSRDAIVYMKNQVGLTHTDPNGLERPINYDTVLVGPENADLADRILNSQFLPGSANNDKNPLYGKMKLINWPRLHSASDSTDTSAYWFMYDSSQVSETLNCIFSERPELDAPEQIYKNKNWEWTLDFYYALGLGYPAYVAGSKGDDS